MSGPSADFQIVHEIDEAKDQLIVLVVFLDAGIRYFPAVASCELTVLKVVCN